MERVSIWSADFFFIINQGQNPGDHVIDCHVRSTSGVFGFSCSPIQALDLIGKNYARDWKTGRYWHSKWVAFGF